MIKFRIQQLWSDISCDSDWHFHILSFYKFGIHHHASIYHNYIGIIILNFDFNLEWGEE